MSYLQLQNKRIFVSNGMTAIEDNQEPFFSVILINKIAELPVQGLVRLFQRNLPVFYGIVIPMLKGALQILQLVLDGSLRWMNVSPGYEQSKSGLVWLR